MTSELETLRAQRDELHEALYDIVTVTVPQLRAELDAANAENARLKAELEREQATAHDTYERERRWQSLAEAANADRERLREALVDLLEKWKSDVRAGSQWVPVGPDYRVGDGDAYADAVRQAREWCERRESMRAAAKEVRS